ncbi:MAG: VWA domain-containing protein, partial [Sandaracinaceae bacterium]|nr:VWA domain-containing protein [Sandaracinaceae bacterium]
MARTPSIALVALVVLASASSARAQWLVEPPEGLSIDGREVDVELRDGLALVTTRVRLARAREGAPLEAQLEVPTPAGAGLARLEVCSGTACRRGVPSVEGAYEAARRGRRPSRAPVGHATLSGWRERWRLAVTAAPVRHDRPFVITAAYVASSLTRDGVVRLTLPAPGPGAPVRVRVRAPGLLDARVDGAASAHEPSGDAPVEIVARVPDAVSSLSAVSLRCGNDRCVRYRAVAGPVAPRARDVFLLLDASPSTRGVAPELRAEAVDALLGALAPESRVVRVAFARRARLLDEAPRAPADVPRDAVLPALGNTTALDAALAVLGDRLAIARDPLVVVVGDGRFAASAAARAALSSLVAAGAEISVLWLVPGSPFDDAVTASVTATLGVVAPAYLGAEAARRVAVPAVAAELRVGQLRLGPLRAGEERVLDERFEGGGAAPWLSGL